MIEAINIEHNIIADFKAAWPCHSIDDAVDFIVIALDGDNLVDYQCEDADHNEIEPGEDSVAALAALFADATKRAVSWKMLRP
jgi:hypothetical protein